MNTLALLQDAAAGKRFFSGELLFMRRLAQGGLLVETDAGVFELTDQGRTMLNPVQRCDVCGRFFKREYGYWHADGDRIVARCHRHLEEL